MCVKTQIYLFKRTFNYMHKWSNLRTTFITANGIDVDTLAVVVRLEKQLSKLGGSGGQN